MSDFNPSLYFETSDFSKGNWITLYEGITEDELNDLVQETLGADIDEWIITDKFDTNDLERICILTNLAFEHGLNAVTGYVEMMGVDYVTKEDFLDRYMGMYPSQEDFANSLINWKELEKIDSPISEVSMAVYIDLENLVSDLFSGSYYDYQPGYREVHVYSR